MTGKEALDNMALTFDEGGYFPSQLGCIDGHFKDVFEDEIKIIEKDLECLEKVKKELRQTTNNFKNSQTNSRLAYKKLLNKYMKLEKENVILKNKNNLIKLEIFNEHDNEIKFTLYVTSLEEAELFIRYFNNTCACDDEIRII